MRILLSLLIINLLFSYTLSAQQIYTSNDNGNYDWEDVSVWTKSQNWMADYPGTTVAGSQVFDIYGFMSRNGGLTIEGGGTLFVHDTLVITGNVNAAGGALIEIGDNGLLIIQGNLSMGGGLTFENQASGTVVVKGELSATGGADVETNAQFYIFDDDPQFTGGATINGEGPRGNYQAQFSNEQTLQTDNETVYEYVANNAPLPVELKDFYGKAGLQNNKLFWSTYSEINFSHFEIQCAVNSTSFRTIGRKWGQGTSNHLVQYSFTDLKSVKGKAFYRLKIVDNDGTFEYSPIIEINQKPEKISVFPNPVSLHEKIRLKLPASLQTEALVLLYNSRGQQLKQYRLDKQTASFRLPQHLEQGIYFLKVFSNGNYQNVKFMVR